MCLGIAELKNVILGGSFFRNYDITIDKINQSISFTRANCGQTKTFYQDYPNDYPKKKEIKNVEQIEDIIVQKIETKT